MIYLASLGWATSVNELCRLMVKLTDIVFGVETVLLSDTVLPLAIVDS